MRKTGNRNRIIRIVLVLLAGFIAVAFARTGHRTDRLSIIADRVGKLGSAEIAFWKSCGPDTKNGGFYGVIRDDAKPDATAAKGLIQQSRFLWTFCTYYEMKEPTAAVKKQCDDLYAFISSHYVNTQTGDFYYKVAADGGAPVATRMCYSEAFAILSFSKYGNVFGNQTAKTLALNCFRAMDKRCHDGVYGGYDQTKDDNNFSKPAAKETNTVLHCIEALAALYEATRDTVVYRRLEELVTAMTTKIIQPQNYCAETGNLNWTPHSASPTVNYGHDLQTAWLLFATAPLLGKTGDSALIRKAIAIAKNSITTGYDAKHGGFFYSGIQGSGVTDRAKVWWTQCEALSGLWWAYKNTLDTQYLCRIEETVTWIEKKQLSPVNKATLYYGVDTAGKVLSHGTNAAQEWKASYHTMRAYLFVEKWIRDYLSSTTAAKRLPAGSRGRQSPYLTYNAACFTLHLPNRSHGTESAPEAMLFGLEGRLLRAITFTACGGAWRYRSEIMPAPGIYTVVLRNGITRPLRVIVR